jgi:hypothetical protein
MRTYGGMRGRGGNNTGIKPLAKWNRARFGARTLRDTTKLLVGSSSFQAHSPPLSTFRQVRETKSTGEVKKEKRTLSLTIVFSYGRQQHTLCWKDHLI